MWSRWLWFVYHDRGRCLRVAGRWDTDHGLGDTVERRLGGELPPAGGARGSHNAQMISRSQMSVEGSLLCDAPPLRQPHLTPLAFLARHARTSVPGTVPITYPTQ